MRRISIALSTFVLVAATADHSPDAARTAVDVAPSGSTHVSMVSAGTSITADIETRVQPRAERVPNAVSACTGSRIPCSLVNRVRIHVGGGEVFVPRMIVLQLADVDRASIREVAPAKFELALECGDASEAYDANVYFDENRVTQLDIVDGEAGMLAQRTMFADLSGAFPD